MNGNEILDPPKTGKNAYDDEKMTWLYETARYYLSKMSETQKENKGIYPHTVKRVQSSFVPPRWEGVHSLPTFGAAEAFTDVEPPLTVAVPADLPTDLVGSSTDGSGTARPPRRSTCGQSDRSHLLQIC